MTTKGRKVSDGTDPTTYQPGDYGFFDNQWWGMTPNGIKINFSDHTVLPLSDGTITVFDPIRARGYGMEWTGRLLAGMWIDSIPKSA